MNVEKEPTDAIPLERRFTRLAKAAVSAAEEAVPVGPYDNSALRAQKYEPQGRVITCLLASEVRRGE